MAVPILAWLLRLSPSAPPPPPILAWLLRLSPSASPVFPRFPRFPRSVFPVFPPFSPTEAKKPERSGPFFAFPGAAWKSGPKRTVDEWHFIGSATSVGVVNAATKLRRNCTVPASK